MTPFNLESLESRQLLTSTSATTSDNDSDPHSRFADKTLKFTIDFFLCVAITEIAVIKTTRASITERITMPEDKPSQPYQFVTLATCAADSSYSAAFIENPTLYTMVTSMVTLSMAVGVNTLVALHTNPNPNTPTTIS